MPGCWRGLFGTFTRPGFGTRDPAGRDPGEPRAGGGGDFAVIVACRGKGGASIYSCEWVVMLLLVRVVLQAFVRFVGCAGESDFEAALALGGVWWSVARAVISNS